MEQSSQNLLRIKNLKKTLWKKALQVTMYCQKTGLNSKLKNLSNFVRKKRFFFSIFYKFTKRKSVFAGSEKVELLVRKSPSFGNTRSLAAILTDIRKNID